MRRLTVLAVFAVAALSGLAFAEPKAPVDPSLVASDTTLLQDESKATDELKRRLHAQVSYHDGVLVIIDRSGTSSGVTVMPAWLPLIPALALSRAEIDCTPAVLRVAVKTWLPLSVAVNV